MALPNPGAAMMEASGVAPISSEPTEMVPEVEPVKTLTAEEMNELFREHESALRSNDVFRRGDIIRNNALSNQFKDLTPLKEGQEAMVVLAGKEVQALRGNPFINIIINCVNEHGGLSEYFSESRFFEKVRVSQTENQKK